VPDPNPRDAKLIQYLNEAYGKEKELETALEAHIGMTTKPPYRKRLKQHLTETKRHAREVERRIKKLGGQPDAGAVGTVANVAQTAANKAAAAAQGPLHMLRGTGEEEKLLKNAKTEYFNEAEEIATYTAIETLAESVGDKDTAKLARSIRREEERMQKYLGTLIPQLTRAVARAEIPAAERKTSGGSRRRSSSASRRSSSSRTSSSSGRSSGSSSRRSSSSSSRKSSGSTRKSSGSARKSSSSARKSSGSARKSSSSARKSSGSRSSSGSRRTRSRS
jgi:ferritin-like metal-binding protein YciE